jgi:hypothetical protein
MHLLRFSLLSLAIALGAQGCAIKRPLPPPAPLEPKLQRLPSDQQFGVPVYLKKVNDVWTASATGDLTDPNTERVKFYPYAGWAAELSFEGGLNDLTCYSWSSERKGRKYSRCTSVFYTKDVGTTVGRKVVRGVFTMGIATLGDALNNNPSVVIALDQEAFNTALTTSRAIEVAKLNAPLWEFRAEFKAAQSSSAKLKSFIARHDGYYDPDGLVEQARQQLTKSEEEDAKQATKRREQEQKLENGRAFVKRLSDEHQRLVDEQNVRVQAYLKTLRIGDRILVISDAPSYRRSYGMVIEMKGPLLLVQWEDRTPQMEWIQGLSVMPLR